MKRIYHPYHLWEDWLNGMWRTISGGERKDMLVRAIEFTGNADLYGEFMLKVTVHWPIACEHNLTDLNINQKAWIGHAACCMAIGCPEDITRQAWGSLIEEQQEQANKKAGEAIAYWNEKQNQKIYSDLGAEGIREWDTGCSGREIGSIEQSTVLSHDLQSHPQKRFGTYQPWIFEAQEPSIHDAETHRNRGEK
jgi:hypothetical protein